MTKREEMLLRLIDKLLMEVEVLEQALELERGLTEEIRRIDGTGKKMTPGERLYQDKAHPAMQSWEYLRDEVKKEWEEQADGTGKKD